MLSLLAKAQEETFPCEEPNPDLKKLFLGKKLEQLYVHACSGEGLGALTSSFLRPPGDPPEVDDSGLGIPDDSEYVAWTCRYSPGNLQDGDVQTAWVEGAKGYGIGEVVVVPCLDLKKPIEMWAGYGKSQKLFQYNARPAKIKAGIIRAEMIGATQYGVMYGNLKLVAQSDIFLQDVNSFQTISIPSFTTEQYYHENYQEHKDYKYFLVV